MRLSPAEIRVLKDMANGLNVPEIAAKYKRSPRTIDCYRSSIMTKLDIHRRVLLTHYAISTGLIECQRFNERKVA